MNVRLHIALDQFFNVFRFVTPIFGCAAIASGSIPVIVLALLVCFTPLLLTWLIPADCTRMGCTGRMQLTTERVSFWRVSSLYECDNCGTVYRAVIFNPNFEITADYG